MILGATMLLRFDTNVVALNVDDPCAAATCSIISKIIIILL